MHQVTHSRSLILPPLPYEDIIVYISATVLLSENYEDTTFIVL